MWWSWKSWNRFIYITYIRCIIINIRQLHTDWNYIGFYEYCDDKPALRIDGEVADSATNLYVSRSDRVVLYDAENRDVGIIDVSPRTTCSGSNECVVNDVETNESPCVACDLYQFIDEVFDLYLDILDESPVHDDYIPLKAFYHVGTDWLQAIYSGGRIAFGDGIPGTTYPTNTLDIVAHGMC